jgi:hypothetical protein
VLLLLLPILGGHREEAMVAGRGVEAGSGGLCVKNVGGVRGADALYAVERVVEAWSTTKGTA